jgi:hypothetical protein
MAWGACEGAVMNPAKRIPPPVLLVRRAIFHRICGLL